MEQKRALITGITGQDGSYLAEFLLDKGYIVYGIVRRNSVNNTGRISHLLGNKNLILIDGDLQDQSSLIRAVETSQPDECYNLAANSFVGTSFKQPLQVGEITGLGAARMLEAIRLIKPNCKYYFAATSELFGKVQEVPQKETTPFYPRSPYGVAKLYGYWMTKNYRESYGMFACSGVLFNHESVPTNTSVLIRFPESGLIDILPIEDMFPKNESHLYEGLLNKYVDAEVWDGREWAEIYSGTAYVDKNKSTKIIQTISSSAEVTLNHSIFMSNGEEKEAKNILVGEKLFTTFLPEQDKELFSSIDTAKFLGFVAGDGYVSESGDYISLSGIDKDMLIRYADLFASQYGFPYSLYNNGPGMYAGCKDDIWTLTIKVESNLGKWIRNNLYTIKTRMKRIPYFVLNGSLEIQKAFLDGYYDADGRKAGWERYYYKGFTTNSNTLAYGLSYIISRTIKQTVKIRCEIRNEKKKYYYAQLRCPENGEAGANSSRGRRKDLDLIRKISESSSPDGHYFDLQTSTQRFAVGPNCTMIHNSPRRGEEFVTRKITKAIADIKSGKLDCLCLGNLDAKRDWGHSKDYVEAMWLMLQQDIPQDLVIATGETHTVREFLYKAFNHAGIPIESNCKTGVEEEFSREDTGETVVKISKDFYRPAEVDILLGDPTLAKSTLGWEAKISFDELIKEMVEADLGSI